MTRFARAKGSKGANEKVAEDATPWHVMKRQAAELRATASTNQTLCQDNQSTTNWKEELRKEELVQRNSNAVWAEFDGKKKKKRSPEDISSVQDQLNAEEPPKKKKKERCGSLSEKKKDTSGAEDVESIVKETEQCKQENENVINAQGSAIKSGNDASQKRQRKRGKNSNKKKERDGYGKKKREKKYGEVKRRKPEVNSQVWIINGRKVEVTMFDRFIVKKEDAIRLKELGKQLKEKKVPQDEIQRTLKLERRRAEKALAREKKKVCFGCRQYGHTLAECNTTSGTGGNAAEGPAAGTGLCFKCGSTEHKAFQCRVKQGDNFGYATCFICKEEGHIARQCPDNPRGLYPRGGGCRLCGDVTHLKKDCPTAIAEKQSSKFTLGTIDTQTSLDDLDNAPGKVVDGNNTLDRLKMDKKIIKF